MKRRTALRKVSKKRAKQNREYAKIRIQFLIDAPFCEVPNCTERSSEIHHLNHREGERLTDRRYFLAVCREHHNAIHNYPKWARARGLFQ